MEVIPSLDKTKIFIEDDLLVIEQERINDYRTKRVEFPLALLETVLQTIKRVEADGPCKDFPPDLEA